MLTPTLTTKFLFNFITVLNNKHGHLSEEDALNVNGDTRHDDKYNSKA